MCKVSNPEIPQRVFSSDHLYLAAYLICCGHPIVRSEKQLNGRVQFSFQDSAELRSATADFLSGGHVEA
jgi:Domain of unknown function (DUF5659)